MLNYDKCKKETEEHISNVNFLLCKMSKLLEARGIAHDRSKLFSPEIDHFASIDRETSTTKYGTPEYQAGLDFLRPALNNHYAKNRHHPEFGLKDEEWKDILGYENIYQVSNLGRVRSLDRISKRAKTGDIFKQGQFLKTSITPKNYHRIQLQKDGKNKNFMVHQLVAKAFLENDNIKRTQVNHKNSIRSDNRASNLEWVTPSENLIHAYDFGFKEAKVKYIVKCNELDIVTEGCLKMEQILREKGYKKASAAAIWAVINGKNSTHLDLTFDSITQEEHSYHQLCSMNLIDVFEMLTDWKASTMRYSEGNLLTSIDINVKKFGISPELAAILKNTAEMLEY